MIGQRKPASPHFTQTITFHHSHLTSCGNFRCPSLSLSRLQGSSTLALINNNPVSRDSIFQRPSTLLKCQENEEKKDLGRISASHPLSLSLCLSLSISVSLSLACSGRGARNLNTYSSTMSSNQQVAVCTHAQLLQDVRARKRGSCRTAVRRGGGEFFF